MKSHFWGMLISVGLLCGMYVSFPVLAAEAVPPDVTMASETVADESLLNPQALAALKRATDYLVSLPRLQIRGRVVYDVVQEDGRLLQFEKSGEISLQRPDRLYAEVMIDDGRHRRFWYDGSLLSFVELSRNQYSQVKMPPTVDAMLDVLEGLVRDPMPLADLLYSDLDPLANNALEADVVGESQIAGRSCLHLAFRGETIDWQLWIEQGEQPFIRKVTISYRNVLGMPQYVAWIDTWQTPDSFDAALFHFTAPAGSEFIKILAPPSWRKIEGGGQ